MRSAARVAANRAAFGENRLPHKPARSFLAHLAEAGLARLLDADNACGLLQFADTYLAASAAPCARCPQRRRPMIINGVLSRRRVIYA